MREEAHALQNRVFAEIADAFAEVQAEARQIELHHRLIPLSQQAWRARSLHTPPDAAGSRRCSTSNAISRCMSWIWPCTWPPMRST